MIKQFLQSSVLKARVKFVNGNVITSDEIISKVVSRFSGMVSIDPKLIRIFIEGYLDEKEQELIAGNKVSEHLGISEITVRKVNSLKNDGFSAKVKTTLSPEINSRVCSKFRGEV